jgi:hypothetical protein
MGFFLPMNKELVLSFVPRTSFRSWYHLCSLDPYGPSLMHQGDLAPLGNGSSR